MAKPKKHTNAEIIQAIRDAQGILAVAARKLQCDRNTIYNRMREEPEIEAAYKEANESTIDFVETKLIDRINKGDTTAIIFFLKTKAKARGYVERMEQTGANGGAIAFKIEYPDDPNSTPDTTD